VHRERRGHTRAETSLTEVYNAIFRYNAAITDRRWLPGDFAVFLADTASSRSGRCLQGMFMASVYAYWYARCSKLLCDLWSLSLSLSLSLLPIFQSGLASSPETTERHNFHEHARKILVVVRRRARRPVISYSVHLIRVYARV